MITTVTLNASIDKAYKINGSIQNGTVMRVDICQNTAGGKGLNVARVTKLCGSQVLATGLVGGFNGAYLESLLDKDEIAHCFAHIKGETRSCINILDNTYHSTEYLEPGCEVSTEEIQYFLEEIFPKTIAQSSVITISGSAPKGVESNIYQKMIEIAKAEGKKIILDTSSVFMQEGMKAIPTMVKPNQEELEAIYHQKIQKLEDIIILAKKMQATGILYVVVSLGKDGALMVSPDGIYQAIPPKVEVVNTVGCGDSMVAAFGVALERELSPKDALKYAVSVASANALSEKTGNFDPDIAKALQEKVELREY